MVSYKFAAPQKWGLSLTSLGQPLTPLR